MDDWLKNLFIFGITPAVAVAGIWGLFELLKYSAPLKHAVLNTITDPGRPPAALFRTQFYIVRRVVLGSKLLSIRRLIISVALVIFWIVALLVSWLFAPGLFLGYVAEKYFSFAVQAPILYICLVGITALIFMSILNTFDFLLTSLIFRRRSPALNGMLFVLAYSISALVAFLFAKVCAAVYFLTSNGVSLFSFPAIKFIFISAFGRTALALLEPGKLVSLGLISLQILFEPFESDQAIGIGIFGGAQEALDILATLAILPMLMTSIFTLSILNISYFVGLLFVRVDLFLRLKYGYDQKKILEEPVEYLGRVACCVAAIAVISINAISVLFAPGIADKAG